MQYIMAQDIVDAYGQALLSKISTPPGSQQPDPAIVERGIKSASAIIDAFVAGRYTLPLAVVPPILIKLAIDIAVYEMPLAIAQRTLEMRVRYDDALKMLAQIASNQISIGLSNADLVTNGDGEAQKSRLGRSIRTYRI